MHRKRSSFTSSSAAIIGGNDDLLMEILLFLPAKSLIRFKLVSKHWRSLISSQYFSHLHTFHRRRLRPQQSFFLRACTSKFFVCDPTIGRLIPFHFRFGGLVRILQSCNGLLLLQYRNIGRNEYHIFNPTTMQSRNLLLNCGYVDGFCLIFDPSESPHYKVVCFPAFTNSTSFLVYHSENHEWKEVGKSCLTYKFWVGLHLNEDFYFVKSRYASFRVIPNPPRVGSPGDEKNCTMESNGYLHHLRLCLLPDKNELRVYETKEIGSGWSKTVLAVDLNPTSSEFSGKNGTAIDLLGIIRGETINDSVLLFHVPGKIIIYRFDDEVSEVLVDFTGENGFGKDACNFGSMMLISSYAVLLLFDLIFYDRLVMQMAV